MATRTFCDHCGNTVVNPTVLSFGPFKAALQQMREHSERTRVMEAALQARQFAGSGGGGAGNINVAVSPPGGQANTVANPQVVVTDVDLCLACVPIWFERVSKLCKASDPKESDV